MPLYSLSTPLDVGKNNRPITCPARNHCDRCPYGLNADDRGSKTVSLDSLLEDGYEEGSADTTADPVISSIYLEDVLRRLREENPVFLDIVYLRADGLTLDEISVRLNIPRTTLHRMLQKIRRKGRSSARQSEQQADHQRYPRGFSGKGAVVGRGCEAGRLSVARLQRRRRSHENGQQHGLLHGLRHDERGRQLPRKKREGKRHL